MPSTATQKILARASGRPHVDPGEYVEPVADLVVLMDMCAHIFLRELWEMGVRELHDPANVMVAIDHRIPAMSAEHSIIHREIRRWSQKFGVGHFFDIGDSGITHQLQIEKGLARPGMFVVSKDVHSPNAGAVGTLAIPLVYDVPAFLALGTAWVRVPETVRINLHGTRRKGVMPRDVAQHVMAELGFDRSDYRVIEWGGPYVDALSIDGRQVLCNQVIEVGAKSAFVNPDAKACDYVRARTDVPFTPVFSDADAPYVEVVEFDVSSLVPQVAIPPRPDNVVPVTQVAGTEIHQAFIGTCAGGMMEDLRAAADVLRGRRVAPGVRAFIAPSTQGIHTQAAREGLLQVFAEAGVLVLPAGCSACAGNIAPLAAGERAMTTATRNEPGRMGSMDAEIYLGNAVTVAASAIAGCIVDPSEIAFEQVYS